MPYSLAHHKENANLFKALSDTKRLIILSVLRKGEQCACDLVAETGIGQSALSYHMKILVDSALVENWQVGKWTHYRISEQGKTNALSLLDALLTPESESSQNQEKESCCETQ